MSPQYLRKTIESSFNLFGKERDLTKLCRLIDRSMMSKADLENWAYRFDELSTLNNANPDLNLKSFEKKLAENGVSLPSESSWSSIVNHLTKTF